MVFNTSREGSRMSIEISGDSLNLLLVLTSPSRSVMVMAVVLEWRRAETETSCPSVVGDGKKSLFWDVPTRSFSGSW